MGRLGWHDPVKDTEKDTDLRRKGLWRVLGRAQVEAIADGVELERLHGGLPFPTSSNTVTIG